MTPKSIMTIPPKTLAMYVEKARNMDNVVLIEGSNPPIYEFVVGSSNTVGTIISPLDHRAVGYTMKNVARAVKIRELLKKQQSTPNC